MSRGAARLAGHLQLLSTPYERNQAHYELNERPPQIHGPSQLVPFSEACPLIAPAESEDDFSVKGSFCLSLTERNHFVASITGIWFEKEFLLPKRL